MEAIDLGDLGGGGLSGMFRLRRRVGWRDEGHTSEEKVLFGGKSEGKMAVDAIARV